MVVKRAWKYFIITLSILATKFCSSECYKILFFAPSLGKSHIVFQSRIADAIASAGHEVVLFEPEYHYDPESVSGAKIAERYILKGLKEKISITDDYMDIDVLADSSALQEFRAIRAFHRRMVLTCEEIIKRKDVIENLKKREFDVYIGEPIGCGNGLAHVIGIPTFIMLTSLPIFEHFSLVLGSPVMASYVPSVAISSYSDEMTYWQRVYNLYASLLSYHVINAQVEEHTQLFRKHFGPDFPSIATLMQNAALTFVNTDEFVDFPRPTQDNIVAIGGIGLSKCNSSMDETFKSQVKMGKTGVVVISLSTHLRTARLPAKFKRNLVNALISLPEYHFIVRVDNEDLITMTSWLHGAQNVYFSEWLPQAVLLNDANVIGLVSHVGANSLMEAAYNGKPVLCMPFSVDQHRNCWLAVRNGWGKQFSRADLLGGPDAFRSAMIDLLEGETGAGYRANATRLKLLIQNKPLSAEDRLNKYLRLLEVSGGRLPELQHQSRNMTFLAFYSLDILAPLSLFVLILVYGFTKTLVWLFAKVI